MSGFHFRNECKHGAVIAQCRCPGPQSVVVVDPCPFPEHAKDRPAGASEQATVVLAEDDYRFITTYDPDRERSASRADMVDVLHTIQRLVIEGRA